MARTDAVWLIETMSPSVRRISCSSECLVPTSSNTQQMVAYKCVNHFEVWMEKCKKHYFLKCAIVANSLRGLTELCNFHFMCAEFFFFCLCFPASSKSKWYRIRTIFCKRGHHMKSYYLPIGATSPQMCIAIFYSKCRGIRPLFFQIPVPGNHR